MTMNTWVSGDQPLMGCVFQYLPTKDICQWRRTSKNRELTDAFSNHRWDDFVSRTAAVHHCGICSKMRGPKGLFHCADCRKNVCGKHVVTCTYCLHDLCIRCFTTRGCCWTKTTQITERKTQGPTNVQDHNVRKHSVSRSIVHNCVALRNCLVGHNHGTKGQHRLREIETQTESSIPTTMTNRPTSERPFLQTVACFFWLPIVLWAVHSPVSYTHLTLPTKRIV